MSIQPATLLVVSLCGYLIGASSGLLFMRNEKLANALSFCAASLSGVSGVLASLCFLAGGVSVLARAVGLDTLAQEQTTSLGVAGLMAVAVGAALRRRR